MAREWYDDRENIARLLTWLEERCELRSIDDAIYLVEKPWKWTPEWNELQRELADEALAA